MCGVNKEIGGPDGPHDAHDAGSWGATGHLKSAINPNKTFTLWSVFVAVKTADKRETGLACIVQAKPYKMCTLHSCWVCFAHISSTAVAPRLVQCVKCGCYWQLICSKNALVG